MSVGLQRLAQRILKLENEVLASRTPQLAHSSIVTSDGTEVPVVTGIETGIVADAKATTAQQTADGAVGAASDAQLTADQAIADAANAIVTSNAYTDTSAAQAKQDAITAAAADAQAKADAAKQAAIDAAALDAQQKADLAEAAALADAKAYTDSSSATAKQQAITTAATDAQAKADAAEADAIAAAALTAQEKADLAEAAAIAESLDWAKSRGADLVTNGTGYLGDNTNFPWATYSATDAPLGVKGSFVTPAGAATRLADELIPVNPAKRYLLALWARQTAAGRESAVAYSGLAPYDAYGLPVGAETYMYRTGTTTTLARPLNPGDTVVYLTSAANWKNNAGAATQWRTIIWWDYTDQGGKLWPAETYSRNITAMDTYADGAIDFTANTVTLKAAYSGPAKPVGTKLSNGGRGGTYIYGGLSNTAIPAAWTQFKSNIWTGVHTMLATAGADPINASTAFPAGTANVKIVLLPNRTLASPYDDPASIQAFAGISFSDASAANATATAVESLTNGWKFTGTTNISGGAIQTDSITAAQIAANAITASEIAADAVEATKIKAGAVVAGKLAADSVLASNIKAGEVVAGKLAAGAVTAGSIAAGAVTATTIAADAVTASAIVAGAVGADEIAANAVTAIKVSAGAIETDKIAAGAVVTAKLAASAVTANELAANAVTALKINAGAVEAGHIKAGAISTVALAADAVTAANIVAGAVGAEEIAANAITADKIGAGVITANKLAVADLGNMSWVNEDTPSMVLNAVDSVGAAASCSLQRVSDGTRYWVERVNTASTFFFRDLAGPIPFKAGDRLRWTFDAYTTVAAETSPATPRVRYPDGTGWNLTAVDGSPTTITDAVQSFKYEGDVADFGAFSKFTLLFASSAGKSIRVRNVRVYRMGAGELVVDGTLNASKIGTGTLTAGTTIKAGDPNGTHAELSSTGFRSYTVDPIDGIPNEAVRIGTGDNDTIAITDATGEVVASIMEDGSISGRRATLTGDPLTPGTGVEIYGTDFSEWDGSHGKLITAGSLSNVAISGINTRYGITEIAWEAVYGRAYRVTAQAPQFNSNFDGSIGQLSLRHTTDGTAPTINSPLLDQMIFSSPQSARYVTAPPFSATGTFSPGTIRALLCFEAYEPSTAAWTVSTFNGDAKFAKPIRMWVEDIGYAPDLNTMVRSSGGGTLGTGGSGGSGSGGTVKKSYSTGWQANLTETYRGDGSTRTDTLDMVQGVYGTQGDQHGMAVFTGGATTGDNIGQTLATALSGATITSAYIELYASHWARNSGGTALIRCHNYTALTNVTPTGTAVTSSSWPKPGLRRVNITSIFTAATRGVWVGKAGSTSDLYYGRFTGTGDLRPRLIVNYTK